MLTFNENLFCSQDGLDGILMWGFWEQAHWRPEAAIAYGPAVVPNKAGDAYRNIYYNTFRTNIEVENAAKSGKELEFSFKAFKGIYEFSHVDEEGHVVESIETGFKLDDDVQIIRKEPVY